MNTSIDYTTYTGINYQSHLDFWKRNDENCLGGFQFTQEKKSFKNQASNSDFKTIQFEIENKLSEKVNAMVNGNDLGIYTVLITGLSVLFHKYTSSECIVLSSPVLLGTEKKVVEHVPLVISIDQSKSWKQHLIEIQGIVKETYQYQDFPLALVSDKKENKEICPSNISVAFLDLHSTTTDQTCSLGIVFEKTAQGLKASFRFDQNLFNEDFVRNMWQHFSNLLNNINHLENTLQNSTLFSQKEKSYLLEALNADNRVNVSAYDRTIVEVFEESVTQHGEHIALTYKGVDWTYRSLNEIANQLAHHLREEYNIGSDDIVGLMLPRSEWMIVGVLAILKAGGAFLPIDADYPMERKEYILEDAGVKLLLTHSDAIFDLSFYTGGLFAMDIQCESLVTSKLNPKGINSSEDLAYVIYTSGSTGQPKGVLLEHCGAVNMTLDQVERFGIVKEDNVLQFASFSFDASISEIFMALYTGAKLVLIDKEVIDNTRLFENYLQNQAISVATLPPAYLSTLDKANLSELRVLITAGEPANIEDALQCSQFLTYFNAYGPTECSVCVTTRLVKTSDSFADTVPIGRAISNMKSYVLDNHGNLMAKGLIGELCVSGVGLARGYVNRPDLTQKYFKYNESIGERLYHTGDLVRWNHADELEYIGRKDNQFKLRGYRVEPEEVAHTLTMHPGIKEAVVLKTEGDSLAAVVVPDKVNAGPVQYLLHHKKTVKSATLPNGLVALYKNKFEIDVLYHEIFIDRIYHRCGLTINDGDVVFDVGANIGLFSLYAGLHFDNVQVFAFEPVPEVFEIMEANTQLYDINVKAFDYGLSNKEQEISFTYYPNNTALSSRYGDAEKDKETVRQAFLNRTEEIGATFSSESLDNLVEERVRPKQIECTMRRISDVMKEQGVDRIDLLKIDVEKSEWEVLQGIDEDDWAKVRQIVVEVHDENEALSNIENTLEEKGYAVVKEQASELEQTNLYNLYAYRPENAVAAKDLKELKINDSNGIWTDAKQLINALKIHAAEQLPDYMVPTIIDLVASIPLTANGKVDKKALMEINSAARDKKQDYKAPSNDTEEKLTLLWEEILSKDAISVNEDFFELGGHSLKATLLISRIYKEMEVEIDLGSIFLNPTIEALAKIIKESQTSTYTSIPRAAEQEYYDLSFAQRRLWILNQFPESRKAYLMPNVHLLKEIDITNFKLAIYDLIARHESLRTNFITIAGEPKQKIHDMDTFGFQIEEMDLQDAQDQDQIVSSMISAESEIEFDLSKDPLLRAKLIQIQDDSFVFLLTMHHIITDGWSFHLLIKELFELYEAKMEGVPDPLPQLNLQYKDYAVWQQNQLKKGVLEDSAKYWTATFKEVPILDIPTDFPRPAVKNFRGHYVSLPIGQNLSQEFKTWCDNKDLSVLMGFSAVVYTLLYKYTGQSDIVVGTIVSGRSHPDLEGQNGFYVNTLALRTTFNPNETFDKLGENVKKTVLGAFKHEQYPFDLLIDNLDLIRDTSRSPLFDVSVELLNVNPYGNGEGAFSEEEDDYVPAHVTSKYDLSFKLGAVDDGFTIYIEYNTDLFAIERVERMLLHFQQLVKVVTTDSSISLLALDYIPEEEKAVLHQFNQSNVNFELDKTIIELFDDQVNKTPLAKAIVFKETCWTYEELDTEANRIAIDLVKRGDFTRQERIGVMLEKSNRMVAAILAVLKVGGTFVTIDPNYPDNRKQYILEDANIGLLIIESNQKLGVSSFYNKALYVLDIQMSEASNEEVSLPTYPSMDDLAYQLYTSGSTGKPKGVKIRHQGIANYMLWANQYYFDNEEGSIFPLFTSMSFDVTLSSLFSPLLSGGILEVYEEKPVDQLLRQIFAAESLINVAKLTPSHIDLLKAMSLVSTNVAKVIVGGEALKPHHIEVLQQLNPRMEIYNEYGPTEATIGSTAKKVTDAHEHITIGRPVSNTTVYILDDVGQVVPIGVHGELYIGGAGVAAGYCNQTDLTASKFIVNPLSIESNELIYRTGDIGKWTTEGEIVLLGRKDHQVKIRGFRIELEEIEMALIQHEVIQNAAVVVEPQDDGQELVAYLESRTNDLDLTALRAYLSQQIPDYMIPAEFVYIEKIPLNSNGKIDRKKLKQIDAGERLGQQEYIAPRNAIEEKMVEIWQSVLNKEKIGVTDNFFSLGGHSLKATQIVMRTYQDLDSEIDISLLFTSPTIAALAQVVSEKDKSVYKEIEPVEGQEHYVLSPAQKRLWITEQLTEGLSVYNSYGSYNIEGELDEAVVECVFQALAERHEVLRTTFELVEGEPRQKIKVYKPSDYRVNRIDLREEEHKEKLAADYSKKVATDAFDLTKGPLVRIALLHMEDEQFVLYFTLHHIISDGWSMNILISEFSTLYKAFSEGKENPLVPLRIHYKDYATWLGQLSNEKLTDHKAYWLSKFEEDAPMLTLSLEHPRPKEKTYNGNMHTLWFEKDLKNNLSKLGGVHDASLFMVLLGVFKTLLYRYAQQEDIVIGTVETGRNHPDLANQIGIYVNTLALRTKLEGTDSFEVLLTKIKETVLGAYQHAAYPFNQLLEDLEIEWSKNHSPLFDIVFSLQNMVDDTDTQDSEVAEINAKGNIDEVWSNIFDLVVNVQESKHGLLINFHYNTDLFSERYISLFASHFQQMAEAIVSDSQCEVARIPYLSEDEIKDLASYNETKVSFPEIELMHNMFEKTVAQYGEHIALTYKGVDWTYRSLNEIANQLAHHLREEYNIGSDDIVGLMLPRSEWMIVGVLAILKAGGAFLPIDADYPMERKEYILEDAGVKLLLTHSDAIFDLSFYTGGLFAMDIQCESLVTSKLNPKGINSSEDLAYVIYTSGSTGQPKGVLLEHCGAVNMTLDQVERFGIVKEDNVLQFASFSFDASISEIFMALYTGAKLVLIDKEVIDNTRLFENYLQNQAISVATLPPAYLSTLDKANLSELRVLITAGEPANIEDALQCSQFLTYFNAYGPTECSVCVTTRLVKTSDSFADTVPIGRAISNMKSYVLDNHGNLMAKGLIGELCVSGVGLARGYVNRPDLTQKYFKYNESIGERLYHTGDLVRWNHADELEYIGRKDNQFKLRGYRVEPEEVAHTLTMHPGIKEAVVLKTEGDSLAAVVVPDKVNAGPVQYLLHHKKTVKSATLPNGLVALYKNKFEIDVLYHEIFIDRIYHRCGLTINDGDVVFDVGANIGLFSLYAGLHFDNVQVFAFEPVPEVFEIMEANTQLYDINVKAFDYGLSNKEQEISFTYYPNNTALSSRYGDAEKDKETVRQAFLNRTEEIGATFSSESLDNLVEERVRPKQIECTMRRISDVMKEQGVDRIDLLKIDVEKSEWEVLQGIDEDDWAKVRQIVVEVHDENEALSNIENTLEEKGYAVVKEQASELEQTNLYNLYAYRPENAVAAKDLKELKINDSNGIWTDAKQLINALKIHAAEQLPDYMVPTIIDLVASIPLTANGKVDKKALMEINSAARDKKQDYKAPSNDTEEKLTLLWEEILSKDAISVNEDFFELGGHSLKATLLISRIYKEMEVEIDLGSIFLNPTIEALAKIIKESQTSTYTSIPRAAEQEYYDLSFAQRRLWILNQFPESRKAYLMPNVHLLKEIDITNFKLAIYDLIARHESLRTNFITIAGEPKQKIHDMDTFGFQIEEMDLQDAQDQDQIVSSMISAESEIEFDLSKDPLLRAKLIQIQDDSFVFLLTMHHIITDGWSFHLLIKELFELYEAKMEGVPDPLPQLNLQYKDYAVWQQNQLKKGVLEDSAKYWTATFKEVPILDIPTDFPRPAVKNFRGHYVSLPIGQNLSQEFKTWCDNKDLSVLMGFSAVVYTLLYKYTGQSDIVVGTIVSGRSHPDLEGQNGFYVNTLALRTTFNPNETFDKLGENVKRTVLGAFKHEQYPFDLLLDNLDLIRDTSRSPLFDVLVEVLNVNPYGNGGGTSSEEDNSNVPAHVTSKYDLSYKLGMIDGNFTIYIEYNTDLFAIERVERMLLHFQQLIKVVTTDSSVPLLALDYIPKEEKAFLDGFSQNSVDFELDKTIIELFDNQVIKTPLAKAIVFKETSWTYEELATEVKKIAINLVNTEQFTRQDTIGIMVERSNNMVAALLAVLKVGGTFVFIDSSYPDYRKRYILEDANIDLLIIGSDQMLEVGSFYEKALYVLDIEMSQEESGKIMLPAYPSMDDLAYQLYTSGSTGKPKGVKIRHQSITNYVLWTNQYYFDNEDSYTLPLFTSMSFDLTLTSLFSPLLRGGTLSVCENKPVDQLLRNIFAVESLVNVVKLTPSHIDLLKAMSLVSTNVAKVIVGGEALKPHHVEVLQQLNPAIEIYNEYGPTETTVGSTVKKVTDAHEIITIGQPVANTNVYVLDEGGKVLPVGVHGEIHIGGVGVAAGYSNQTDFTASRFIVNPLSSEVNDIIYKTGDIGKWTTEGEIILLGRKDHQVKIRGFRIELEEIEMALIQHEAIQNAAVVAVEQGDGQELIAYVERGTDKLSLTDLRTYLSRLIPDYMIPSEFVYIEKVPLNSNGKIDREKLKQMDVGERLGQQEYVAPRNAIEEKMVVIWQSVLDKEKIGVTDDFFSLGGHSLKATQIVMRTYQDLDCEIDISSLFTSPTIAELAQVVAEKDRSVYKEIEPVEGEEYYVLSPAQKRLWITEQLTEGLSVYNSYGSYIIEGKLDEAVVERVFQALAERHEILRTTFELLEGEPRQKIKDYNPADYRVNRIDLREEADKEQLVANYSKTAAIEAFDLSKGPLVRISLLQMEDEQFVFHFTLHHIISDGWSMNILVSEFSILYKAFSEGGENPLVPLRIHYKDYATWLDKLINEKGAVHKAYWQRQFEDVPPVLVLPLEHPRPKEKTYNGSLHTLWFDKDLKSALTKIGVAQGASLFMVLLGVFKTLLYRYTQEEDIVVGTVETGRNHPDLEKQIGIYVNTLALRTQLDGTDSFELFLAKVKETVIEAYQHAMYSFNQLLEDLEIGWEKNHSPLFDIMFSLENLVTNANSQDSEVAEINARGNSDEVWSNIFDLVVNVKEAEHGLLVNFHYNTDLFSNRYITLFAAHFKQMAQAIVSDSQCELAELTYMSVEEMDDLSSYNETKAAFPEIQLMHSRFENTVAQNPDLISIVYNNEKLTYDDLNKSANRMAHYLRKENNILPNDIVAIILDKSEQAFVAILGVLKSGAAYLPIDPNYPQERIDYILKDANVKFLVTNYDYWLGQTGYEGALFIMDEINTLPVEDINPILVNDSEDTAYVIYTSGSTGLPKGVMISHRSNINMASDQIERLSMTSEDNILQFASLSFDASIYEIFMALYAGATLVVAEKKVIQSTDRFRDYMISHGVSVAILPPAYLKILDIDQLRFLRVMITAGEAANVPDAIRSSNYMEYYNGYGPTEAAVCVSTYLVGDSEKNRERIPIGKPINNMEMHILDERGQVVPIGVEGELFIGGPGLAKGYLNRPLLTSERFIELPAISKSMLYKTGDVCKRLPDGNIDYVGRNDDQVKINGFRIEMGEITSTLQDYKGVEDVHVLLENKRDDKKILAFVVPSLPEGYPIWSKLRAADLALENTHTLPNGMVISQMNHGESDVLYEEVFEQQQYLKAGIEIKEGDVVFDIGANIGMFSLFVGLHCPTAKIYAFEPVAPVFKVLERNIQLYGLNAQVFSYGLSNEEKQVIFTYYSKNTALSGQYGDLEVDRLVVKQAMANQTETLSKSQLEELLTDKMAHQEITCQLRPLSDIIEELKLDSIDLLKVDVEKSELEVIQGLRDEDWAKIKQAVVEVYDINDNLKTISKILEKQDFNILIQEEETLEGTGLYMIYATKKVLQQGDDKQALYVNLAKTTQWKDEMTLSQELFTHCHDQLPAYMVPKEIIFTTEIPLTINGKVDKKLLSKQAKSISEQRNKKRILPRNIYEEKVANLWKEILYLDQVDVTANFFELGGNSLKATQIIAKIYKLENIKLDLTDVFQDPTVESFAKLVEKAEKTTYKPILPIASAKYYAVSHAQRRLLLGTQLGGEKQLYNIATGYLLEDVDPVAFEAAVRILIEKHEVLRTTFHLIDGVYQQKIHEFKDFDFKMELEDISQEEQPQKYVQDRLAKGEQEAFDLGNGPLFRTSLLHLGDGKYVFLIIVHHVIFDSQSIRTAIQDIMLFYKMALSGEQVSFEPLTIQYKDYAFWQNQQLDGDNFEKHAGYWKKKFVGEIPKIMLPLDFPRPEVKTYNGSSVSLQLDEAEVALLEDFSQKRGVSLFMSMQALVIVLLYRFTGQTDIILGIAEAGRDHPDLQDQIGYYINTLALRTSFSEDDDFDRLLTLVQETTLDAYKHMAYPFDLLVESLNLQRDTSRNPLFDVGVLFEEGFEGTKPKEQEESISGEMLGAEQSTSQLDMKFAFVKIGNRILGEIVFNSDLFEVETIEYMKVNFLQILESCIEEPTTPLNERVLPEADEDHDSLNVSEVDF